MSNKITSAPIANQITAKLLLSPSRRQVLLNPTAAKLWCKWYQIGSIAALYDSIADDPSLVSRIDRFAAGLKALKPGMIA